MIFMDFKEYLKCVGVVMLALFLLVFAIMCLLTPILIAILITIHIGGTGAICAFLAILIWIIISLIITKLAKPLKE